MEARDFQQRLAELYREFETGGENADSYKLTECERCINCVFCNRCQQCVRCNYCTDCMGSSHLTHCTRCTSCHHMANSLECTNCASSAYLVLCRNLSECNYCFGCVGLAGKDFHILNKPYDRSEYFEIIKGLSQQLNLRR